MKQFDKTLNIAATIKQVMPMGEHFNTGHEQFGEAVSREENIVVIQHTGNNISQLPVRTDHYALVLCLEGNASRSVNQFRFQVTPGSLHLVRPKVMNAYRDASPDLHLYILFFRQEFLADNMLREARVEDLLDQTTGQLPHRQLNPEDYQMILALFQKLDDEVNSQKLFHGQMLKLFFMELLLETGRLCGKLAALIPQTNRQQLQVSKFKKLVEDKYLELRTVQEYADLLFVTPKHLSEIIKQETGLNPLHLIHNRIFQEAKFWLCASELTIKEISDKLNFDTSSHFSRFIKQFTGYHPTEFRRIQCTI